MILGYNNPKIDKAARLQYDLGNTVSVASPIMIELAETLTDMIDIADWSLFGKNGGDSTQLAVMVARAETCFCSCDHNSQLSTVAPIFSK